MSCGVLLVAVLKNKTKFHSCAQIFVDTCRGLIGVE